MNDLGKYKTKRVPTWCGGCGDFIIWTNLQRIFSDKKLDPAKIVICYDIGCSGNMADFLNTYGVHTLHGRVVPLAAGVKMYRPDLLVIAIGGDGGIYGEGLNHLITSARKNVGVKVMCCNNLLYSLTTGQASPTTPKGAKTKSTPFGSEAIALDPVKLIKDTNSKVWVDSANTKKADELLAKMRKAIDFNGFSFLDIDQTCVTFRTKMIG